MSKALELAKECWHGLIKMPTSETTTEWFPGPVSKEQIEIFYRRAQEEMRERCANLADEHGFESGNLDCQGCGEDVAAAIRALEAGK